MALTLAALTLLVRDYDPAIEWFTRCLGFHLIEDTPLSPTKRWVKVGPASGSGAALLLARAANARQRAQIGRQSGGRVFLFLQTTRFWTDYRRLQRAGVRFIEKPRHEPYGWVVVFEDLHGNRWDLLQARPAATPSKRRAATQSPRTRPRS
jgi:catechol 2,3-dioxygenase-like lactoylglutathione lyase family enzyme